MYPQLQRIRPLDIMRGFAVVVMVIGHSIDSVLGLDVRTSDAFRLYDAVRGFTAPIFLFVAGYAFIVATEKRWAEFHVLGRPVLKRLSKILLLLLVGYALHVPFFSLDKILHNTTPEEYAQFFQVDVLHCLAASMVLLQMGVFLARTPRGFAVTVLASASGIVLVTPLMWQVNFAPLLSPVVAPYVNGLVMSIFPIFPYAGFFFFGTGIGHFFLPNGIDAHLDSSLQRFFFWKVIQHKHRTLKSTPRFYLSSYGVIRS